MRPPTLDRVFDRELLGRKWKHVIDPRVTYRYVTGVDNFAQILRFDERDILSDTNEVEYGVVNRFMPSVRRRQPEDCMPPGMSYLVDRRPPPSEPHSVGTAARTGQCPA